MALGKKDKGNCVSQLSLAFDSDQELASFSGIAGFGKDWQARIIAKGVSAVSVSEKLIASLRIYFAPQ